MELFFQANCELEKISVWFKANKVSLNVGKYIFLKKKVKQIACHQCFQIYLSMEARLKEKSIINFLAVIFDENISQHSHILRWPECANFLASRAIADLVGLVSSCLCAFGDPKCFLMGISRIRNFISKVFRGFKLFSRGFFARFKISFLGYFVDPRFFLVLISWAKFFSRGYFVGNS